MTTLGGFALRILDATRHLEHLAVSMTISAHHFFEKFDQDFLRRYDLGVENDEGWPNLKTLALTYMTVYGPKDPMLRHAAIAALLMPKLTIMELWSLGHDDTIFRYVACGKGPPRIELSCSKRRGGKLPLTPETLELWQRVARKHGEGDLVVEYRVSESRKLALRYEMVGETHLRERILSDVSRYQQLWEYRHKSIC